METVVAATPFHKSRTTFFLLLHFKTRACNLSVKLTAHPAFQNELQGTEVANSCSHCISWSAFVMLASSISLARTASRRPLVSKQRQANKIESKFPSALPSSWNLPAKASKVADTSNFLRKQLPCVPCQIPKTRDSLHRERADHEASPSSCSSSRTRTTQILECFISKSLAQELRTFRFVVSWITAVCHHKLQVFQAALYFTITPTKNISLELATTHDTCHQMA